jgi:DDE family transposase
MRTILAAEHGKGLYRKRMQMIEPVFGHTKHNRLITRFHRRGRAAVRTEWRLLMATCGVSEFVIERATFSTQR